MRLLLRAKRVVDRFPYWLGNALSSVPFTWRLGPGYTRTLRDIAEFRAMSIGEKKRRVFERTKAILDFATANNSFYRKFYASKGFDPATVRSFEDLARIPIVTKADLRAVSLEERTVPAPGRTLVNTGGTSGEPLAFYLDRDAFAREWAHMHTIWAQAGYRTTDLKLTFRGRNLGSAAIQYSGVHHEYYVNACVSPERQADAVARVASRVRIIHGYPSSVYEFVKYCSEKRPAVLATLRQCLKGVFLASEYPAPVFRSLIESQLGMRCICWYGHSEFAILAPEAADGSYVPFHSYGYCEAVENEHGQHRLIGTSYFNQVSPFIRYDTGDLVSPVYDQGLLVAFRVEAGRFADFVVDRDGNRISLTAFIFGRHHPIFRDASFVQVRQERPGAVTLVVTLPPGNRKSEKAVLAGFDLRDIALDFSLELRDSPILTPRGKVPLLVRSEEGECNPR